MKFAFYILFGCFGLLGAYFVLTSLVGRLTFGAANQATAKAMLLVAAATGGGLLYWAYQLGEVDGRWLAGIGAVVLAVVGFQMVMVIGRVVFG